MLKAMYEKARETTMEDEVAEVNPVDAAVKTTVVVLVDDSKYKVENSAAPAIALAERAKVGPRPVPDKVIVAVLEVTVTPVES